MEFFKELFDTLFHLTPDRLGQFFNYVGIWLYVILFLIIFAETGLVVTPFLPGDSLLFAIGAVAATTDLNILIITVLLCAAAVIGDAVNYSIGYWMGPKVFTREDSWLLNKKHLLEAQRFYERYGGKTIIIARFVPIVRTFAPFVAGIGKMTYPRFAMFNVVGGIAWVVGFVWVGFLAMKLFKDTLGEQAIEKYFKYVIAAIIVISILPIVIEFFRARRRNRAEAAALAAAESPAVAALNRDAGPGAG